MNPVSASIPADEAPEEDGRRTFAWNSLRACGAVVGAVGLFQTAFEIPRLGWLTLGALACLFDLRRLATARQAFYAGLIAGLGVFVFQTGFLWTIFGPVAPILWLILASFHAMFVSVLSRVQSLWGTKAALILAPVLWCGIEFFRSEVWWLRFTWFAAASPFQESVAGLARLLGTYGLGAMAMGLAGLGLVLVQRREWRYLAALLVAVAGIAFWGRTRDTAPEPSDRHVQMIGIQLEFPGPPEVLVALTRAVKAHPEAELIVLSEYTFDGPVPDSIQTWCAKNHKWLIAGGKELVEPSTNAVADGGWAAIRRLAPKASGPAAQEFYNTAFVVGPDGQIAFRQAKSRPIQFFSDGLPARTQQLWESPWGPIGIAICYDLSYRQVVDGLIRRGARALVVPTMDVESWGVREHRHNARMTRLRATECGVPIFRVASSGISQWVNASGRELAVAPFPGAGALLSATFSLASTTSSQPPIDAWAAPIASVTSGAVLLVVVFGPRRSLAAQRAASTANSPVP